MDEDEETDDSRGCRHGPTLTDVMVSKNYLEEDQYRLKIGSADYHGILCNSDDSYKT